LRKHKFTFFIVPVLSNCVPILKSGEFVSIKAKKKDVSPDRKTSLIPVQVKKFSPQKPLRLPACS
jgi:hypothetical protein